MYNWLPKLVEVNSDDPDMLVRCDRCGFLSNSKKMVFQWDFRGTPQPINTRVLTCGRPSCLDQPNPQQAPIILSPDPEPVFNARPYPYELSETSWLSTEDGDIITTQDDEPFITPVPVNPGDQANASDLTVVFDTIIDALPVAYLDLFNGDPLAGGVSVLSLITGSPIRTDVRAQLAFYEDTQLLINQATLVVADSSATQTNVNYAAFYDAATGGTLVMSTAVVASTYTIAQDNLVQFLPLGLSVYLGTLVNELMWGAEFLTWEAKFLLWGSD